MQLKVKFSGYVIFYVRCMKNSGDNSVKPHGRFYRAAIKMETCAVKNTWSCEKMIEKNTCYYNAFFFDKDVQHNAHGKTRMIRLGSRSSVRFRLALFEI